MQFRFHTQQIIKCHPNPTSSIHFVCGLWANERAVCTHCTRRWSKYAKDRAGERMNPVWNWRMLVGLGRYKYSNYLLSLVSFENNSLCSSTFTKFSFVLNNMNLCLLQWLVCFNWKKNVSFDCFVFFCDFLWSN